MKVKICGVTRKEDALLACEFGAWAIGFNFFKASPRYVTPEAAALIIESLPSEVVTVGVFVNATTEEVERVKAVTGIQVIQLHGDESPESTSRMSGPVFKAFRLKDEKELGGLASYQVDSYLVDSFNPRLYGGTGERSDWELAIRAKQFGNVILAGGLTPQNIVEAANFVQPYAVDVCSGVEAAPGVKDAKKLEALFSQLKNLERAKPMTPDERGYFGEYGGKYVPETLFTPIQELEAAYAFVQKDSAFQKELSDLLRNYVGRATPLTFAKNLSKHLGGARIYLKREDLAHLGAHKINNCIGQALLARHMGKTRVIAETGAGQHGVATAAVAALLGLKCTVYMGAVDVARQEPNVTRMKLLGAEVISVHAGSQTLKDAINEAMRDWAGTYRDSHYLIGSVLGPHPYPVMVRDFQSVIGSEARAQILEREGRLPDELIACVGGGSNSIGLFHAFLDDKTVAMTGVEAGGNGISSGLHAARFAGGSPGVLHGTLTYLLQDEDGQVKETHSVSAGLDYPSIGPEHAHLASTKRVSYTSITDTEALEAFRLLAKTEGILPALESAHAVAEAIKRAPKLGKDKVLLVNLSGRGDKDIAQIQKLGDENAAS